MNSAYNLGTILNEMRRNLEIDAARVHLISALRRYAEYSPELFAKEKCQGFVNDCLTAENPALELATAIVTGLQHNTWPWSDPNVS